MAYKVLIVEDDPMVSMINEQYVNKNPKFEVASICKNGQEALDYLDKAEVDLIVLDVFMPYMDGIETLKKIREKKVSSEVIMVTAANDSSTIEQTMHLGVIDYLNKPLAYDRFQVAMEKNVSKYTSLKQNAVLDQSSIDSMISNGAAGGSSDEQELLPKGIQKKTLLMIQDFWKKENSWQTVDMVSEKLGISIVTARHYLNYLEEQGEIQSDINYETGGRPSVLYKRK